MIERTLSTRFEPGTNLSGSLAHADWRYLLSTQELQHVLCIGAPAIETAAVISTIASQLWISEREKSKRSQLNGEAVKLGLQLSFLDDDTTAGTFAPDRHFALIYFTRRYAHALINDPQPYFKFIELLGPQGMMYCEVNGRVTARRIRTFLNQMAARQLRVQSRYWLTPFSGELRTAVPLGDRHAANYFFRNVLFGQSFKKRALSRIGRTLSAVGLIDTAIPRQAIMLTRKETIDSGGSSSQLPAPPRYLIDIAKKHGQDIKNATYAFSARGKYNSNKVIFFLFHRTSHQAEIVIKMTRSSQYNGRLRNEYQSLKAITSRRLADEGSYPEGLFYDEHRGLAMIAIRAVHGRPFRAKTRATPDCPIAQNAADWLLELGKRSLNLGQATPVMAGEALGVLLQRFVEIYNLPAAESAFLENQVHQLSQFKGPFPTVFQHGDPGIWNMLVAEGNRIIVIDWESAEPQGLPLWDLLYFYRTYASWVARQQGGTDPVQNFEAHFLQETSLNRRIAVMVRRYCEAIELDPVLIRPLFYTCWMHRALKEAMRLEKEQTGSGTFVNILRSCIHQAEAPGLQAILQNS